MAGHKDRDMHPEKYCANPGCVHPTEDMFCFKHNMDTRVEALERLREKARAHKVVAVKNVSVVAKGRKTRK